MLKIFALNTQNISTIDYKCHTIIFEWSDKMQLIFKDAAQNPMLFQQHTLIA
jgi:hypothetical protein